MPNPLKVQTATTPNSLKVMSDAEMDYIAQVILADFASVDTGVGTLQVDPVSTTGLTNIGSFIDTSWSVAAGTALTTYQRSYQAFFGGFTAGSFTDTTVAYAPTEYGSYISADQLTTATANVFWQDLRTASESLTRPLEYDTGLNRVIQQIDASLNASIMSHTLDRLAAFGLGSYKLAPTAPLSGGTWTAKATITDVESPSASTPHYLWRRTTQTAPTTIRPLKTRLNGNIYDMIEMTDADIETLTDRFRNRIVSTEIGTYALQESAPGVGTWTRAGDITDDQRGGAYTATYNPQYTSPNYTTNFTSPNYTSSYTSPNYTTNFTSPNYVTFFGGFSSPNYTTNFTSPNYTSSYTSPNYTSSYTSPNYTTNFTGANSYTGTYIGAVTTATSTSLWIRTA